MKINTHHVRNWGGDFGAGARGRGLEEARQVFLPSPLSPVGVGSSSGSVALYLLAH